MKKLFYSFLALSFLLSCASPYTISRLTPDESEISFWEQGRAFLSKDKGSYTVKMAFEDSTKDHIIMNLEIYNFSENNVLIDPLDVSVRYRSEDSGGYFLQAIDPESTILELDRSISINWAQERNAKTSNAILAAAELTTLAAGGDPVMLQQTSMDRENAFQGTMSLHAERNYSMLDERDFYRDAVLRRTTIHPGRYVAGKLVFKRIENSETVEFNVPVAEEMISFHFYHFAHLAKKRQ